MAYPKINVNTGIVKLAYASDTVKIPVPGAALLIGQATVLAAGTADQNLLDNLSDSTANFIATVVPLPIVVGDRAINVTGSLTSLVTSVLATDLTLAADSFPNGNENYALTRPFHLIDTSETFVTKGIKVGDIVRNTSNTNTALPFTAYVTAVNNEVDLTLSVDLFGTIDDFSSNYVIYSNPNGGEVGLSSAEGCLLYVASATPVGTAYATGFVGAIKVKTVAGDDVVFQNVPVGTYLPVQITQLFSTSTTPASRGGVCLAIW
tara:strand:+ start:1210 stop:1998 length:789 start_codon:yes stop_codon:yes gene_type:complete